MKTRFLIFVASVLMLSSLLIYAMNHDLLPIIDKGLISSFSGLIMGVAIVFIIKIIRQQKK